MILTWFKTLFIGSNCLSDVRVTQAHFPEWRQSDASAFPRVTSEWRKRIYRAGVTLQPNSRPYYDERNNCSLVRWVVPFIKLSAVPTFGSNINAFIIKLWCIILCAILTVTYCIILCYRMGCVLLWIHFTVIHSFWLPPGVGFPPFLELTSLISSIILEKGVCHCSSRPVVLDSVVRQRPGHLVLDGYHCLILSETLP